MANVTKKFTEALKNPFIENTPCGCDICKPEVAAKKLHASFVEELTYKPDLDAYWSSKNGYIGAEQLDAMTKEMNAHTAKLQQMYAPIAKKPIQDEIYKMPAYDFKIKPNIKPAKAMKKSIKDPWATIQRADYESFSHKDLVGVIRGLLEELGRTTVQIPSAGTSFTYKDTVVNNVGSQRFISFRGLVDDKSDEEEKCETEWFWTEQGWKSPTAPKPRFNNDSRRPKRQRQLRY